MHRHGGIRSAPGCSSGVGSTPAAAAARIFSPLLCCAIVLLLAHGAGQGAEGEGAKGEKQQSGAGAARFLVAAVTVDPGSSRLAAYQIEIRYDPARVRLVGVEGGEGEAFRDPPRHDPKGLTEGRIVLAAFAAKGTAAPAGPVVVARLHLRVLGSEDPALAARAVAAAEPGGERIAIRVSVAVVAPAATERKE